MKRGFTRPSYDTKQDWVDQVVALFNAQGQTIANGRPIVVTAYHVGSGSSMNTILDGKIQPTIWSPGSRLWVNRLKQTWSDRTGQSIIRTECPATILANGRLKHNGFTGSIHQMGKALQQGPCNGWEHWYYCDPQTGRRVVIDKLRETIRQTTESTLLKKAA